MHKRSGDSAFKDGFRAYISGQPSGGSAYYKNNGGKSNQYRHGRNRRFAGSVAFGDGVWEECIKC
jgi:hypothetical protein